METDTSEHEFCGPPPEFIETEIEIDNVKVTVHLTAQEIEEVSSGTSDEVSLSFSKCFARIIIALALIIIAGFASY